MPQQLARLSGSELRIQGVLALGEKTLQEAHLGRSRPLKSTGKQKAIAVQSSSSPCRKPSWRGSDGGVVLIWRGTSLCKVDIHPVNGPKVYQSDGSLGYMRECTEKWSSLASADQKVLAYKAADWNRSMASVVHEMAAEAEMEAWEKAAEESPEARVRMRCDWEIQKGTAPWSPISIDTVNNGHDKRAPGMLYGLEFPWSASTLLEFGPEWLTTAFHACASIPRNNRVNRIIPDNRDVTAGNNSGKFLFEVEYARRSEGLHTKLFAKVPFSMSPATKTDRISSSVYKQPMDYHEVNTYRLLEARFPFKTPKFYFGDISNETSNCILITERIPYAELDGLGRRPLRPFEVEGPYDKCKDYQLNGRDKEYYSLLMVRTGQIAAAHKAGKFGRDEQLLPGISMRPVGLSPEAFGCDPARATGPQPRDLSRKLDLALKFMSETAQVLYPKYVASSAFQAKFKSVMLKRAAYHLEIECWKHIHLDYVALGHQNLNADNAYFWRDQSGTLDCGLIDWGGFGSSCLGHKIYWMFNCAEFENFRDNISDYMDIFIKTYSAAGGPSVNKDVLRTQILLTSLANLEFMVDAVPNCFKMCSAKEWTTIKDRSDPRIAGDVGGKSTLRTTLHCLGNGIRIIEEMNVQDVLDSWIKVTYEREWGRTAKPDSVISGEQC